MITVKNVKTIDGEFINYTLDSSVEKIIDGEGLTLLPGLIDPHVHFRTPGQEYKENWKTGAQAALAGGVTTVIDMPNNIPSCITKERLSEKQKLIERQLEEVGIPLRYHLYFGADQNHLEEILKVKDRIIGIKVYMGSTTGDLLMTDESALEKVFQLAAKHDLIVSVHAEDEKIMLQKKAIFSKESEPSIHSKIRDRSAAIKATTQAINLAEKTGVRLFVLHISTKEEIDLIREAKRKGVRVYAEITPHHLFFSEKDYAKWGTKVQMNPPLRTNEDQDGLWEGIYDGTVDTIGTDHAPHTLEEKKQPYGKAPSGVPGVETLLPLLLNAYNENRISLEQIVALTRTNAERLFRLESNDDVVLVDMDKTRQVCDEHLKTKCGWSPYSGQVLKGWPIYTILKGQVFSNNETHL